MKFPAKPPRWPDQIKTVVESNLVNEYLDASDQLQRDQASYLHWDEFRHRCKRHGTFSPEQLWSILKQSRETKFQELPFRDTNGKAFRFFLTQLAFEKLSTIDRGCAGGLSLPKEVTNHETRDRYYLTSLVEESLTSSQLEGAVVTRAEAREMIRNGRPPATEHEKMVLNNFLTMRQMQQWKNEDLTPELLLTIHRQVTEDTLDNPDDEGRFRVDDSITIIDEESNEVFHRPPPHPEIEGHIDALCQFANERRQVGFLHPVIRAITLHFWLAYLHPFADGNGRTARALFYWSMLRQGFWLFEFISISHEILKAPKKYYRAFLYTETDDGDLNYFIHHQLEMICRGIDGLLAYIERKRNELETTYQLLRPGCGYNHRQLALLRHALRHPQASYTVVSHQNSHGISNQTSRTDLQKLADDELLGTRKVGKAMTFFPSRNLSDKLTGRD